MKFVEAVANIFRIRTGKRSVHAMMLAIYGWGEHPTTGITQSSGRFFVQIKALCFVFIDLFAAPWYVPQVDNLCARPCRISSGHHSAVAHCGCPTLEKLPKRRRVGAPQNHAVGRAIYTFSSWPL